MKHLIFTAFLLLTTISIHAQLSEEQLKLYLRKGEQASKFLIEKKITEKKWDRKYDAQRIAFTMDTMRIEQAAQAIIDGGHYSTADMRSTNSFMYGEYDKLLNKYYKLLIAQLSPAKQTVVRDSQRTWLNYREKERKLNWELVGDQQGTMWPVVEDGLNLDILKNRVETLFYLYNMVAGSI